LIRPSVAERNGSVSVQAIPDSKRYEYREGQKTVAVIEAAAVEEAIRLVEPRST
jgi:hypothetical protein